MVICSFSFFSKVGVRGRRELRRWGEKLWREGRRGIKKSSVRSLMINNAK
jgi:hypothetical protein